MTRERMELWSNDNLSEFSIKFKSATVVTTSSSPNVMVKMIDECPYKEGYNWDWHFTLSQWVVYYLANKFTVILDSNVRKQKDFKIQGEDNQSDVSAFTRVDNSIKMKTKPSPRPGLKCHFCNLKYCLEEERKQHEEFWHRNKLIKL
jgi:hypothetical protein